MKLTQTVTTITAAVAMALGVAAPALADTGSNSGSSSSGGAGATTDQQFLQALKTKGIHMTDSAALSLAHSTCAGLAQGGDINAALMHVKSSASLSDNDAMTFGGYAVYAYCRQYMPKKGTN